MALPKLNTPTYELEVPSTDEKIKYRPFLVKEEKILLMAMESKDNAQIINAVKDISKKVESGEISTHEINEELIDNSLSTSNYPNPELMIRTSGEHRISNFLLWQLAYAELYFTPKLWPDFREEDLFEALLSFQKRERRFGKTSEQITETN